MKQLYTTLIGRQPDRPLDVALDFAGLLAAAAIPAFVAGTLVFGRQPSPVQYGTVLVLGLVALFLLRPGPFAREGRRNLIDAAFSLLLVGLAIYAWAYMLENYRAIAALREGLPNQADMWCYALGSLAVVFGAHRAEGWALTGIVGAGVLYLMLGQYMPGFLAHRPFAISEVLEISYSYQGIFGVALASVVDIVYIFVILGVALRLTGAGELFSDLALMLARGRRSGPAQCAIVASALFGSINGSAPANVASTGVLTIPMMRRAGFSGRFAGGVEATASCVGQIMPPVMGVGAFIMSDVTGIPYVSIMLAAVVPALLYIASLSVAVTLEAWRLDIQPLKQDRPRWTAQRLSRLAVLLAGFAVLLALLFSGYPATYAGLIACGVVLATAMLLPPTRFTLPDGLRLLVDGGRDGLSVLVSCAAIGIVIAAITTTGLGIKLNQMIAALGEGHLLLALLLAALCSIVLGMGLPTAASYLMVVFVAGPAIMELGVGQLETHLFVFYYAVMSAITPPVALAVFAAAAIAAERPLGIALQASKLAVVGFILPIAWIYHPEIMIGAGDTYLGAALAYLPLLSVAVVALAAAVVGFFFGRLMIVWRLLLGGAGLIVFLPGFETSLAGAFAAAALLSFRFWRSRHVTAA